MRILHLSDLHLNTKKTDHDQIVVIDALCSDIALQAMKTPIDYIFFTGDLVAKGFYSESYVDLLNELFVDKLLDAAKLTRESIIFCSGNHDVELSTKDKIYEAGLKSALSDKNSINDFISDHENNVGAFNVLAKHNAFTSGFAKTICKKRTPLFSSYILEGQFGKIGVSALNSSWRATGRPNDEDCGTLVVGERQVELAAGFLKNCSVKIALIHHPLNWLAPKDFAPAQRAIARNFDILLHGHVHEGDGLSLVAPFNNLIVCGAGCLYQSRDYFNGYSILTIDQTNNTFRQETREYFGARNEFDLSVRFAEEGIFEAPLKRGNRDNFLLPEKSVERISEAINRQLVSSAISNIAPGDIDDLFVEPRLSKVSQDQVETDVATKSKQTLISIPELEKSGENFFIWGRGESGKTTTLNYLVMRATRQTALTGSVAFYVDGRAFSSLNAVVTAMGGFCDGALKRSEVENALNVGRAVVHIDNCPLDVRSIEYQTLVKLTKAYPRVKFIFSGDESLRLTLVENRLPPLGVEVSELFLLPFTRRQVRALIKNWFGEAADESSLILDGVLRLTAKLQLPRSPFLMSMVLWLNERKIAFSPVNYATLIENFIDGLLEKLNDSNFRSEVYTFRIKQHFLSELAAYISQDDKQSISRLELEQFAVDYFKARPQPKAKPLELLEHFFNRGMLLDIGEEVRFKLDCFREYFVARRMLDNSDYLAACTSPANMLRFTNALDYYSGLKQDDVNLLRLASERLEDSFIAIDLNVHPTDYARLTSHDDSMMNLMRDSVHDLTLSRPSNVQREQLLDDFDEMNVGENGVLNLGEAEEAEKREDIIEAVEYDVKYSNYMKHLLFVSMVLRNSELVSDSNLVEKIFASCMEHWSRNVIFALAQMEIFAEDRGLVSIKDDIPRETRQFVSTLIPMAFLGIMNEKLGTAKLADVMHSYITNTSNAELPVLLTVLIYAELGLPRYMDKIENFVARPNLLQGSFDLVFTKILMTYFFKILSPPDQLRIETFLAQQVKKHKDLGPKVPGGQGGFVNRLRDHVRLLKVVSPDDVRNN